jgi:hypothetical protein
MDPPGNRARLAQENAALRAQLAAAEEVQRRLVGDLRDAEHTVAAVCAELHEIGAWVRLSRTNADLLAEFYWRWGITRPTPPRPTPLWATTGGLMQGIRIQPPVKLADFEPGAYGKVGDAWLCCTPNGLLRVFNAGHTITEHPDGTITVHPSILVAPAGGEPGWHGYLEAGVWREV